MSSLILEFPLDSNVCWAGGHGKRLEQPWAPHSTHLVGAGWQWQRGQAMQPQRVHCCLLPEDSCVRGLRAHLCPSPLPHKAAGPQTEGWKGTIKSFIFRPAAPGNPGPAGLWKGRMDFSPQVLWEMPDANKERPLSAARLVRGLHMCLKIPRFTVKWGFAPWKAWVFCLQ